MASFSIWLLLFVKTPLLGSYVMCPYCDPNYVAYPNIEEACRGYDLPMGNPNPEKGNTDPGIRNQIFEPMYQNKDGYYALRNSFITANIMIKCDASWRTDIYDTYQEYTKGKMDTSSVGFGVSVVPQMDVSASSFIETQITIPSIFSRSTGSTKNVENTKDFFTKERGSIAISEAICLTQRVDIHEKAKKVFTTPFQKNILLLHQAASADNSTRLEAFKRFINDFGTHYSAVTHMGTKISIERRYTAQERAEWTGETLKDCNELIGSRILGFQAEQNSLNCSDKNIGTTGSGSELLDRTVVSTFGSYLAESLVEWTKQVVDLVQNDAFQPHSIKRKLVPIYYLFTRKNFEDLNVEGGPLNLTAIFSWFLDYYGRYCEIFDLECGLSGCGIDDTCPVDTFCIDSQTKAFAETGKRYKCVYKEADLVLPNKERYVGLVNAANQPQGLGRLYSNEDVKFLRYKGQYDKGLKHGLGTVYYKDGTVEYKGMFKQGLRDGPGKQYQQNGNLMYTGVWGQGNLLRGKHYSINGEIIKKVE